MLFAIKIYGKYPTLPTIFSYYFFYFNQLCIGITFAVNLFDVVMNDQTSLAFHKITKKGNQSLDVH